MFSQLHVSRSVGQEVSDPLTDGAGHVQLGEFVL